MHARGAALSAIWAAILLQGCAPGGEPGAVVRDTPEAADDHVSSMLVMGEETFTAYYGGGRFDPDAVFGVAQPEITFNAFRAPLTELDGETHEVDLAEPSGWTVLMNLQYAADVDVLWHTLQFDAGMPGFTGHLTTSGSRRPRALSLQYSFSFVGEMELPGFSDGPVDLTVSSQNLGMANAEEIRQAPRE